MKNLVIIGAGELGREIYWHSLESIGYGSDYTVKGYIDDDFRPDNEKYQKLQKPLLSSIDDYEIERDDVFISAIGSGNGREATVNRILAKGGEFISLIHRTALIHGSVMIGAGVFVGPYAVIGDSVVIGDHVMLNTHSSIGHDAVVGDYSCIMSYVDITGGCKIGKRVFMASGCRFTPSSKIGDGAYIGIGSVVLRRVKANTKVFGNPAKPIDI